MEYLNFQEISEKVPFRALLDWLNIPYKEKNGELKGDLRGELFIVTESKNKYFLTKDKTGGGVINFLSDYKLIDLRASASELKKQFLTFTKPKSDMPELKLEYCKFLEEDMAR